MWCIIEREYGSPVYKNFFSPYARSRMLNTEKVSALRPLRASSRASVFTVVEENFEWDGHLEFVASTSVVQQQTKKSCVYPIAWYELPKIFFSPLCKESYKLCTHYFLLISPLCMYIRVHTPRPGIRSQRATYCMAGVGLQKMFLYS